MNSVPLTFLAAKPRKHRRRRQDVPSSPPTPAALTLVSASYDHVGLTLTMAFDRAIDIAGFDGAEIEVDDGTYNHGSYVAGGAATLVNATTLRATLHFLYGGAAGACSSRRRRSPGSSRSTTARRGKGRGDGVAVSVIHCTHDREHCRVRNAEPL